MKPPISSSPVQTRQTKEEFARPGAYLDYELGKAVQELPPLYTRLVAGSLSLAVFGAIAWAALNKVDDVAVARGKVLAGEQKVQPATALSSGKIKDIKVREGQQVQKGDTIIELDSNAAQVDIETLKNKAQLLSSAEKAAAQSHKADMKKAQIEYSMLGKNVEFAKFKERKDCPDYLPGVLQDFPALYSEKCKEAQNQLNNLQSRYDAQKQEIEKLNEQYNFEHSKLQQELNSVKGSLKQAQIQLQNQSIIAPINGTVYEVKVSLSQGTVQAGQELLSIAPVGQIWQKPVIEVDLPAQYQGLVDREMRAKVKIDAFDYRQFSTVNGTVISISPNSVPRDNSDKLVFPTRIELDTISIKVRKKGKMITSGMPVTAEIVMQKKSILSLILDPITQQVDDVFSRK